MKKILNNINNQLIIGISLIVLTSTVLVAIVFLSQYRNITLRKTEKELEIKAIQLSKLGATLINPNDQRPNDLYFEVMKDMVGNDLLIISNKGELILTTIKRQNSPIFYNINSKYTNIDESILTYQYSDYFGYTTLTIAYPIIDNGINIGTVLIHQNVDEIYRSYISFSYLVYVSIFISLIASIILTIFYSRFFTKPIEEITKVAKEIKKGNYKAKTGIKRDDQIGDLSSTIDQMSDEIDKNITEIKELEQQAKDLVANVSHEFKTPLTLIRGYTMNLKDKSIKASSEVYDKIISSTVTLENLVNDLLTLNKYQSNKIVLKKEPVILNNLLEDIVSDMKELSKSKEINIIYDKPKKLIDKEIDYTKFKQLITILLDNAIKYSKDNTNITVLLKTNEIKIIDEGIGIEKKELDNIFKRYYQVKDTENGYGLGLCIAKYIVDAHDYNIKINSIKNKGTTVTIELK
jgi:signal transduction histidine kinase